MSGRPGRCTLLDVALRRLAPLRALVLAPMVLALLAGCATPSLLVSAPKTPRWEDRMRAAFADPSGLGGGSGGAPGSMQFASPVTPGDWVVTAGCTGTDVLRLHVHTGAAEASEAVLTCGTTTRLPIVVEPGADLSLIVEGQDRFEPSAVWFATINSPEWTPRSTASSRAS